MLIFRTMLQPRYWAFLASLVVAALTTFATVFAPQYDVISLPIWALSTALALLGIYDVSQRRHAIRRNYPIVANMRFLLESIRPEMRQYFFEGDKDGAPFPRDKRAIVYQRAKKE
ncbi:MAG: FMN-binding glutamate synthase family protein, partial [Cypionkella sp.]|nr:FMN-binding glutamate synthase family protein [Cypionkella sp.]